MNKNIENRIGPSDLTPDELAFNVPSFSIHVAAELAIELPDIRPHDWRR